MQVFFHDPMLLLYVIILNTISNIKKNISQFLYFQIFYAKYYIPLFIFLIRILNG